jgi:DNA polymerase-3 subunit gamma/tau
VQYELGDAVSVGDAKSVFELVHRLVQEGQDLRHVTNEVLGHFRNLLLAKTAPGQPELLDLTEDQAERLAAQAAKYTAPELARVISLLLAAQTDMRWTTSPRLSLELALIRSTIPEADERPEALVARMERLERIAGVVGSGGGPGAGAPGSGSAARSPSAEAPATPSAAPQSPSTPTPAPTVAPTFAAKRSSTRKPASAASETVVVPEAEVPAVASSRADDVSSEADPSSGPAAVTPVLGAGTSAVDVSMLRQNWRAVIQHLQTQGKKVIPSFLEVGTPAAFDGTTLEVVFPPDRKLACAKVKEREGELREALHELFGISPAIDCVMREPVAGIVDVEVDPPLSEEEALARLTAELGATPVTEDGS